MIVIISKKLVVREAQKQSGGVNKLVSLSCIRLGFRSNTSLVMTKLIR